MRPDQLVAGRYRLLTRIGAGGMGTVWRARDQFLDRDVALKTLRPDLAADDEFRRRFEQEARLVAALKAPGIVAVHDVGEDETDTDSATPYLVMEFIEGKSLADLLRDNGSLTEAHALDIVAQTAEALEVAHRAGIIHRDVKPANLLIGPSGKVTVVDFGIARVDGQAPLTATGVVIGTAAYASPEQLRGDPLTPASDVYSLGIVLRACLTGASEDGLTVAIPAGARAVDIVNRCTAAAPVDRFGSAMELAAACRSMTAVLPPVPAGPMPWPPAARPAPSRWITGVLAALAALTVLAAGTLAALNTGSATITDSQAARVVRAATLASQAILSYDYRTFDDSVTHKSSYLVGAYRDEFLDTASELESEVLDAEAVVTAEAVDGAVTKSQFTYTDETGTEYDDAVSVLLFVNQSTENNSIDGAKTDSSRVEMTMVPVDDGWKAANADVF